MYTLIQKVIDLNESKMWYLTVISLIIILVVVMILRLEGRRKRILANKIPGPDGSIFIGLLPLFLQGPEKLISSGLKVYQKYEKSLFKVWVLNNLYIVLTRPEDIELVLTNPKLQKKSKEYLVLQESIMGQGIFSIDDIKKWKSNRKMVSGGFNFKIIKSFIPIFYEESNVLNNILKQNYDLKSNECDISSPISMATMEMIGKTALGVKFYAQNGGRHRFVENLQTAMIAWEYRITHPWYLSKTLFRLSSVNKKHDQSQKIINDFTDEIINKKLDELNQNANNEKKVETDDEDISRKTKTVIEILLGNYHEMSHEQIRDELVTIMIGGQETTAMANACAIFMLAHHPDVQNKVFEELQSIFSIGDQNRSPTYEDLQQMEYLERVIKETLRIFPPLPVFGRSLEEEMQIGEYLCPAGSTLMVCPLFLQSSTQYFTDPEKFNPDNFLPDTCRSRHPYTFIPFSAGYRNCIGIKYGMLQMKTVISTLVRKNTFFPSDRCPTPKHLKLMFLTTLKFVDGCYVKIVPRTP
ncbi:cytochrome P450 4C1-like isoform X1 [Rhopalosiphum maidis]|uniref:cytochrome P450 4C1-like isoform X1 n=1 Tax=Rhopalosiphum maidis TaxID=43146 RepID=UPI000EFEB74A|nr:cytochrome P450 4C1-like isoform X1 [Rhopalosiphum maidis]